MNNEINRRDDNDEIDLLQLFQALKRRWLLILAAMVLCGGIAGVGSKMLITPQYTSQTMMYILSKETTLTSLADLQIGSQLTKDYSVVVTSRPVMEEVIEKLNLNMSYTALRGCISIGNPADTRILTITVTNPDPVLARNISDSVAEVSSRYIGNIMEMVPPKIIERAVVATNRTSPSHSKNAMMGALLGAVLVCGVTVLETLLNDTIQTEEDVEQYLGLSILASVPIREEEKSKNGKSKAKENAKALRFSGKSGRKE